MDILFIGQIIGLLALSIQIIGFIEKKDKPFFLFLSISSVFWSIHYFLIGLNSGGLVNIIDIIKNYFGYKAWKQKIFFFLFLFSYLGIGFYLFDGSVFGLIPIIASLLSIYAIFFSRGENLRIYYAIIMFLWLLYNFFGFSIAGIVTNLFLLGELLYTYSKIHNEKKRFKKKLLSVLGDKKGI